MHLSIHYAIVLERCISQYITLLYWKDASLNTLNYFSVTSREPRDKALSYQDQKTQTRKKKRVWELHSKVHTTQQTSHIYPSLQKYRIYSNTSQGHLITNNSAIQFCIDINFRYKPQQIELETKLKPFIPDYIPSVGDIDAFLKAQCVGLTPRCLFVNVSVCRVSRCHDLMVNRTGWVSLCLMNHVLNSLTQQVVVCG